MARVPIRMDRHLYLHLDPAVDRRLDELLGAVALTLREVHKVMASLDETLELVRAANNRQDSLIELTRGIKKQLDEILAGALPPAVQEKVDAIFAEVSGQAAEVDAAINENDSDPNT